ncbi:MAG TPA: glycosyltransferase [Arachnia sp.]|nr:glycosyltransferase [Arachnia sp.]HMT85629.1 glycosyltransferase [Arachnia sp.]
MPAARRLIIVNRADPVICGHSVEGRNLAEVALTRGFDDVRIVTWPLAKLETSGLPLKPLNTVLPYSPGIHVERPEPVGDYKVPDGRYLAGITGRLIELLSDGTPTIVISLYLSPHTLAVDDAVRVARTMGGPVRVTTIAEAVGSDITNIVRTSLDQDAFGAAAQILSTYLRQDLPVAVSEYTRDIIVDAAAELDARHSTRFAAQCLERIGISYPAIDTSAYLNLDPQETQRVLTHRGLQRNRYVFFLSRLHPAKAVDDLIAGFERAGLDDDVPLVIAGRGPDATRLHGRAAASPLASRIRFLDDVGDAEKPHLMEACGVYALPSKPRPDFVETFGIALVEKMLAGGGPVITTSTGGIGEAVGGHALIVPVGDPNAIAVALQQASALTPAQVAERAAAARRYAMRFDRGNVFDRMIEAASRVV